MSRSTASHDQLVKLAEYREPAELREIVFVDPQTERVRILARPPQGAWSDQWLHDGADLIHASLDLVIPSADIVAADRDADPSPVPDVVGSEETTAMKLYYSPGACSLASHVALHEAGLGFEHVRVDLKAHTTERGDDFTAINPKGYVPALILDTGEVLTENVALLDWIAQQSPSLRPEGALGRTRLLELLAFISTEIHKSFKPFFAGGSDEDKRKAGEQIGRRFGYLAERLEDDFLTGAQPSVADFYLLVVLLWAAKFGVEAPASLVALRDRLRALESVQKAMRHEGLI